MQIMHVPRNTPNTTLKHHIMAIFKFSFRGCKMLSSSEMSIYCFGFLNFLTTEFHRLVALFDLAVWTATHFCNL